jgi:phosphoenolpyruvate synthase/pyruvate phosphate dikinase
MNPSVMILPLDSQDATLANVGGKGANLAKLAQAGWTVSSGLAEGFIRIILDPQSA